MVFHFQEEIGNDLFIGRRRNASCERDRERTKVEGERDTHGRIRGKRVGGGEEWVKNLRRMVDGSSPTARPRH